MQESLHRTLVEYLVLQDHKELAAMVVDCDIEQLYSYSDGATTGLAIDLFPEAHDVITNNDKLKAILESSLLQVVKGHYRSDAYTSISQPSIEFRMKFLKVEEGWKEQIRRLIVESKENNQGTVTEKIFRRRGREPLTYNEMKFASKSEIAIAQALEERRVLFFPLPLAVRSDTGAMYKDHREVDFLVCHDGVWGILEVAYHPDRYEQDKEKDAWFKESGILCIEHYTAERCFNHPSDVVGEFLGILAKHKR